MAVFSIFQVISLIIFSLFIVGLLNNLWSDTENSCEMTYMFEYPQFVRIKVPNNEHFLQYGLYSYSEGRFTERARKMRFDGIPVLFLPGNAGSYKQARSIASVALRKALESNKYNFHFDYFTVDYNEENSGIFGGILKGQRLFATHCIDSILKLYNTNNRVPGSKPTSVIVIGHSMGGIVARSLMINPQTRNAISLIITLASPHKFPIVTSDYHFDYFYKKIEEYWNMKTLNTTNIAPNVWKSKILISIGGGAKDFLVASGLTYSKHSDVNVLTNAIPGVWLSTNHVCIVWCKELVLVINRFLFSVISETTKQLTDDTSHILSMANNLFKVGENRNISHYTNSVDFIPDSHWHEDSRRIYFMSHDRGVTKTWYYMIRLIEAPHHEKVTLEVVDIEDKDWIFGCQAKYVHGQYRICLNGRHLSKYSEWAPYKGGKRRTATLNLKALKASYPHWTHLLVRVSPTFKPVKISVDIHNEGARLIQAKIPSIISFGKRVIIQETQKNALTYNITLPGFEMLYQAFVLFVEPITCNGAKTHLASAKMFVPWAKGHEIYSTFSDTSQSPMRLSLFEGNPNLKNNTQLVHVVLSLDPRCTYTVSIAPSFYDSLGQLSRHYATSIPAYISAVVLLVLRHWAASMERSAPANIGSSFHSALCGDYTKPYYLLLSARMGTMLFVSVPFLAKIASDLHVGAAASQNFLLLPLFLYIVALGLMHILGAVVWCLLVFSGQIAHKIIFRLISVGRGGGIKLWDWAATALRKAPGAGGSLLVALATGSCGAVALVAGAAFYFFLLTKMYEDYLEDLVYKTIKKVAKKLCVKKPELKSKKNKKKSGDTEISNKNMKEDQDMKISGDQEVNKENEESAVGDDVKKTCDESKDETKPDHGDAINPKNSDSAKDIKQPTLEEHDAGDIKSDTAPTALEVTDTVSVKTLENPINDESNTETSHMSSSYNEDEDFSLLSLHFHFAMFFLWCFITLLNVPVLLTWAHNYKYSKILDPDPSYIPGIIMCASAALLWQIEAPKRNILYYDVLKQGIYAVAVVVLISTPMALYRLNYLLPIVFAVITLHQTFPKYGEEVSDGTDNDSSTQSTNSEGKLADDNEENKEETHNFPHVEEELSELDRIKLLKEKIEAAEAE